jgi:N-acetylglucosaminyldiphosphoundecaprenol N-acetyl-beta-D-mannosaminyltransferase
MTLPETVELFGVRLHPCCMDEAVDELYAWIDAPLSGGCRYVVTPNVNHVVRLQRDEEFARVYAEADFVLADGVPIVAIARFLGRAVPERVAGSDLVPRLFDRASARRPIRVFMLGALPEVCQRARRIVEERWPAVAVIDCDSPPGGFEGDDEENRRIVEKIARAAPDVLIVGLGAPKQELWVHRHRHAIQAKVALCVGATIDFLAGERRRAPVWMRRSGLEWAYRVANEPRRLSGRYFRDGLALPRLVLRELRHSLSRRRPLGRPNTSRERA